MFGKLKSLLGKSGANSENEDPDDIAEVEVQATSGSMTRSAPTTSGVANPPPPEGSAEQAFLAGELRAAQKIQMGLVPKTFPPIPGCLPFDLYAILEPAREIGGDFYDFWLNGRENLMLVVGDVSGKGIPAALFMAVCRTYLRAFSRSIREPAKLLEYLNNEVSRHNESCMFVTLLCAVIHIPTGTITYANAGHNPPFIRKADGAVSMLDMADDMPVGFMNGVHFATKTLRLETGDSLFFYTDGMPEAFNDRGEILGDDVSLELFRSASTGGSCRTAIGQLRAEVSEFANGAEQSDDITLMMYKQLEQTGEISLSAERDLSGALEGESGMMSLSGLNEVKLRESTLNMDDELGLSLSGFTDDSK